MFRKYIYFLFLFLFCSCIESNPSLLDHSSDEDIKEIEFIWICHNPESIVHDKECTEPVEEICLSEGDQSKFCWILTKEQCLEANIQQRFEFCKPAGG